MSWIAPSLSPPQLAPRSRFDWLMGLYAENFTRLQRLFDPDALTPGHYVSSIGDSLDLHLHLIERHPYTLELRMSYALLDPVSGESEPSAFVRLYRDAQQAETTHCYIGRRWQDVLGLHPPLHTVVNHRLRMNTFLNKWLAYLAGQGHGVQTLFNTGSEPAETVLALA